MRPRICKKCLNHKSHFTDGICTDCFHDKYSPKDCDNCCSESCELKDLKKIWEWKNNN